MTDPATSLDGNRHDEQFETPKVTEIRRGSAHGATASIPGTSLSCDRPLRSPEDHEEWGPMTSLPPGGAYDTPRPEGASAEWYTATFRRRMRNDEQRACDLRYEPTRQVQAARIHPPVGLKEAA